MSDLLRAIGRLAGWQKAVIAIMVLLIVSTWLAVCLILASYIVP